MRNIYFVRHGMPDFPGGEHLCLGSTDLPLSVPGRLRASLAALHLENAGIRAVFSSPLKRAAESASFFGIPVTELDGLREADAGEWDGLSFREIRENWPELYERRGKNRNISPPGAESPERALTRFRSAFETALKISSGNIVFVVHRSVLRLFLADAVGLADAGELPYGSVTSLTYGEGKLSLIGAGELPHPEPDREFCLTLLSAADTPENIQKHCEAVAQKSLSLACSLSAAGLRLDEDVLYAAAMLHDIARRLPNHAAVGAEWLRETGYPEAAEIISRHHDWSGEDIDEAAVLFIADKMVSGTAAVSLAERFEASRSKCVTAGAVKAHDRQRSAAEFIAGKINALCGKDLIL